MKFYPGPGRIWMNNHVAGIAYVVFWCVAIYAIRPHRRLISRIVLTVFLVTCALEFLQLSRLPILQSIRSTFIGRTLIGSSFDPFDFVYYIIGALIGWMTLMWVSIRAVRR